MPKVTGGSETAAFRKQVGERIRSARDKQKWTQGKLGDKVGVSVSSVSGWEIGRGSLTVENLRRLCIALEESSSFLLAEPLRPRDSLDVLSRDLGAALGHRLVAALLQMPKARMRREIAAIVGQFLAEHPLHNDAATR